MGSLQSTQQPKKRPLEQLELYEDDSQRVIAYAIKRITKAVVIVLALFMTSITSCSIASDLSAPIRAEEDKVFYEGKAKLQEIEATELKAKSELEKTRTDAIMRLLADNLVKDPIQARCAIVGWENENEKEVCIRYAPPPKIETTKTDN